MDLSAGPHLDAQAVSDCLQDSIINDYFLHLIASAPKFNDTLIEILQTVLKELQEGKEAKLIQDCPDEIKASLDTVWAIFRGLHVLLCPEVFGQQYRFWCG